MIGEQTFRVELVVTQADIDAGVRSDCEKCPAALALARALSMSPLLAHHALGVGQIEVWFVDGDGQSWSCDPPYWLREFEADFDEGWEVAPFTGTLVFERDHFDRHMELAG